MKFSGVLAFTTPSAPPEIMIIVFQGDAGWFYLKRLYEQEGPATPFSSIQELEMAVGEKLTLVYEKQAPGQKVGYPAE